MKSENRITVDGVIFERQFDGSGFIGWYRFTEDRIYIPDLIKLVSFNPGPTEVPSEDGEVGALRMYMSMCGILQ